MKQWKIVCLMLLAGATALAQPGNGAGNGGEISEAQLKIDLERIADLLETDDGKTTFPEIQGLGIPELARSLHPKMTTDEVKDRNKETRTCINQEPSIFLCNYARVNSDYKRGPALYVTLLHELLNLKQQELSKIPGLPSIYDISVRIAKFAQLKVQYDWVLSEKAKYADEVDFRKKGLVSCTLADPNAYSSLTGRKRALWVVLARGNIWIAEYGEPGHWSQYSQGSTQSQLRAWAREEKFFRLIGVKPRLKLLYSGKMKFKESESGRVFGEAFSKDFGENGLPKRAFWVRTYNSIAEIIEQGLNGPDDHFPITLVHGRVYGQDLEGYGVDGKTASLICEWGMDGIVNNSSIEFEMLEKASRESGHIPFTAERR